MTTEDRSAWHCLLYSLILREQGYTTDEAIGLALERHPRALKHYKCPKNISPDRSAAGAYTRSNATAAERTSSSSETKPYARVAAGSSLSSGAIHADPQ